MSAPLWVTAFLDFDAEGFDRGVEFWQGVTGFSLSERRGEEGQFATLLPPDGDDYLRVQRLADGGRVHLDLHVANPHAAATTAVNLGAQVLLRSEHGYVVLSSPGGLVFCFVDPGGRVRPQPASWPSGRSQVDQVCLDVSPELYDDEVRFWQDLTGWDLVDLDEPEFARLQPPPGQPLRWLVQRLFRGGTPVRAHLDLAAEDRDAEVARHVALGATEGPRHDWWTVLTDPAGTTYCVTRRPPR